MTSMLRTETLQPSELQALFGEEKDYSCSLTDIVHHTEQSDCENAARGATDFRTLCDPESSQSCPVSHLLQVSFNQEYYIKLEELKREHIRNIAELEKLYLNQSTPFQKEKQPRRERQLSTSREDEGETESEQVELMQAGSRTSAARANSSISHLKLKRSRQNSCEELRKTCRSQQNSSHSAANQVKVQETSICLRQNYKITVPKPFHMMLREEDRKRRNVKTRSEVELENERLRRELNELKECGKKFRAKPAPTSTHMPFYDIINRRLKRHRRPKNQINSNDQGDHGNQVQQQGIQHRAPPIPQKPFSFIERERIKREKKLADELNSMTTKEEHKVFKARPVPKSLYRAASPSYHMYDTDNLPARERQNRRYSALPSSILEDTLQEGEQAENEYSNEFSSSNLWKWKNKGILQMDEEMERKRNRERERDWSYIHPLRRASFCHSQELSHTCKSDYISV